MKLLLTSGGLRNEPLNEAFLELAGLAIGDIKVAFIPTALNTEPGDKGWAIAHMTRLQKLGVGQLDIVDISALDQDQWLPRLEAANVIFVSGGNTGHLMRWITQSGLQDELPRLLQDRLYVGVSAGSYVMTPEIRPHDNGGKEMLSGLGYVDCALVVHYKNPAFPGAKTLEMVQARAKNYSRRVYVLDDESAVRVVDGAVDVISEGEYLILNN